MCMSKDRCVVHALGPPDDAVVAVIIVTIVVARAHPRLDRCCPISDHGARRAKVLNVCAGALLSVLVSGFAARPRRRLAANMQAKME